MNQLTDEHYHHLVLNALGSLNAKSKIGLVDFFGSATEALSRGPDRWEREKIVDIQRIAKARAEWAGAHAKAKNEAKTIEKEGVRLFCWGLPDYPDNLREIFSPPPIIYALGKGKLTTGPAVAVVGSRRCSFYGKQVAARISKELAEVGIVTVSGLARGIDQQAHMTTLEAGGETWAVLGGGLMEIYPAENRPLAKAITQSGLVLSEFPLHSSPRPAYFPQRNRIISGLSQVTVVVEGTEKSGALITARFAAEQGRDVMAVPGPITSNLSVAPNRLIQNGAKCITATMDILEELNLGKTLAHNVFDQKEDAGFEKLDEICKEILNHMGSSILPKDKLAMKMNKLPQELSAPLLTLELGGWIENYPGNNIGKKAK